MSVSLRTEEDKPGSIYVDIEGELTVQHAAEFKACLLDALDRAQSVLIDLKAMEDMDLTCLQLLCSAHKSALSSGKTLTIDGGSPPHFERSLDLAGFSRSRGCTMDANNSCLWIQRR